MPVRCGPARIGQDATPRPAHPPAGAGTPPHGATRSSPCPRGRTRDAGCAATVPGEPRWSMPFGKCPVAAAAWAGVRPPAVATGSSGIHGGTPLRTPASWSRIHLRSKGDAFGIQAPLGVGEEMSPAHAPACHRGRRTVAHWGHLFGRKDVETKFPKTPLGDVPGLSLGSKGRLPSCGQGCAAHPERRGGPRRTPVSRGIRCGSGMRGVFGARMRGRITRKPLGVPGEIRGKARDGTSSREGGLSRV